MSRNAKIDARNMKILNAIWVIFLSAITAFAQSSGGAGAIAAGTPASQIFAEEKFLASDGKFVGEIYVADDADIDELRAAEDLARWIQRVCGTAKITVRRERNAPPRNARGIFFGNTRAAENERIFATVAGTDSFAIVPRGNSIFFVAGTTEGLWHAEARFARDILGVDFVFPGDDGAEWSPKRSVLFPREKIEFTPPWTWRSVSLGSGAGNREWALHLGFGERPQMSHNLSRIFTGEIYQKYPELQPVFRGEKVTRFDGSAAQANLSLENSVVVATEAASEFFIKNPAAPMFSVGINDSTVWDESPESEKLYGSPMKWYRNLPDRSDYFWNFASRVAERVAGSGNMRQKKVAAIAYLDTQNAPSFLVSSSLVPVLCADRSMWVFPKFREDDMELMRRWSISGATIWGIYDYYYGMPFLAPRIFFDAQAESLKFAYDNGARLFYAEISAIVPFDAPKIWLLSRLLENPRADAAAELSRFFKVAYGKAAPQMHDFFEICEKTWREQGGQCRWIKAWRNENAAEIFPEKTLETLANLLKNAREALPQEPESARDRRIVARIEATQKHLARARAFARSYFERKKLIEAKLDSAEEIAEILRSPAWNFEEIYSDENFPAPEFAPHLATVSDPRATVFVRIVDALRAMPKNEARSRAENMLAQLLPGGRNRFPAIEELHPHRLVPALSGAPIVAEDFEPDARRSSDDGEMVEISKFVTEPQTDWRVGKNLGTPKGWRSILAPAENAISGETNIAHGGKTAFRVAGRSEGTEISRDVAVNAGEGLAVSIWARGKLSVGASAGIGISWRDAAGNELLFRAVHVPCGEQKEWRRFVSAGVAPAGAKFARIFIGAGLLGDDDEVFFDDLSVFSY
ncbi:MAG: DUF4838 domain-containing protein [Opitutae bacterium]|nr:DUF4838 domain-containing protein [Opitutae bacterium]